MCKSPSGRGTLPAAVHKTVYNSVYVFGLQLDSYNQLVALQKLQLPPPPVPQQNVTWISARNPRPIVVHIITYFSSRRHETHGGKYLSDLSDAVSMWIRHQVDRERISPIQCGKSPCKTPATFVTGGETPQQK